MGAAKSHTTKLAPPESIALRLAGVEIFRRQIDEIPSGFSAAVRLEGEGLAKLQEYLAQRGERVYVHLYAGDE